MQGFVGTRLSIMMFLQFFVWGAWYSTVSNYMKARDVSGSIGDAFSVGPIAAILSPFFLGLIADRYFATERVLSVMHLFGGLALLAAPSFISTGDASSFIIVLLVHMLFYMPTLGLTNTLAFHNVADQEKQFPFIRAFGTIGWIVAGVIVSYVLKADKKDTPFYVAGSAGLIMAVYSLSLPHTPPPSRGQKATFSDIAGLKSLALMKDFSFSVFLISSFLICIPLAAYYAFTSPFLGDAGFSNPAFKMTFGQMFETLFMFVMPLCFRKLGVKWMLLAGMLAWVVRYGLFALGAPDAVTWMIMGGVVLHGICYDFFFVTGQIYVDKKADPSIRGQAQGFLVLVTQGLGMLIGAQIAGYIHGSTVVGEGTPALASWQDFWIYPGAAAGIVMILFFLLFRDKVSTDDQEEIAHATVRTPEELP